MAIPLEDQFGDIVGKAMQGLKMTDGQVAEAASLTPAAVQALRQGTWDEPAARKLASVLGLDAEALVALGRKSWHPEPIVLEGLAQITSPYQETSVNAYLVWDAATHSALVFDTTLDCAEILRLLSEKNLRLDGILLTHTHTDHIFELDLLREKTGAPAFVSAREALEGAECFTEGRTFSAGRLRVETRLTWGHSKGGITYVVHGLERPVAIVGDALFAGSMGGGGVSYPNALATSHEEILSLPDETIIAPGHGPMTTVAEQKKYNPFFPAGAETNLGDPLV